MKRLPIVLLSAAIALSQPAQSANGANDSELGTIDAITSYCRLIDRAQAADITLRADALSGKRSRDTMESKSYQQAFLSTGEQLAKADKTAARSACSSFAAGN